MAPREITIRPTFVVSVALDPTPAPAPAPVALAPQATGHTGTTARKKAGAELFRPVRRKSKRGEFLTWLLDSPRTIGAAIARYRVSRRAIMVNLWFLHAAHGIGYDVTASTINIHLPGDCTPADIWR